MELGKLKLNRFLGKDNEQQDQTKNPAFTGANPVPKTGNAEKWRKLGQAKGSTEDGGAPQVWTGTVITACFIQTSALPSRIELEGNNLTFYDDTFTQSGRVLGDTSRLVFTHDLQAEEGFIMEKRASVHDTYDNVISWYATPPKAGRRNWLFIGRDGRSTETQTWNLNHLNIHVNYDSSIPYDATNLNNGVFSVTASGDQVLAGTLMASGLTEQLFGTGSGFSGYSSYIGGADGGIVVIGSDVIPAATGIDLGSPSAKFGTFYGSVSACPLPTVENALSILESIPSPTLVGERGHYGDRLYFDDLTFPAEVLFTDSKGRVDIEHNHMLGFLLKAVVELNEKVKALENNQS